jgi:hypothetical protein
MLAQTFSASYVSKPIRTNELFAAIESVVAKELDPATVVATPVTVPTGS